MTELHLKHPEFTYIACGLFTKHRERIQKFRKTGNLKYLHRNELDKTCFTFDAVYSDSKDLATRFISDKILKDKAYEIARNWRYDEYQIAYGIWYIIFLMRKENQPLEQMYNYQNNYINQ